jgi:hypothetical protein
MTDTAKIMTDTTVHLPDLSYQDHDRYDRYFVDACFARAREAGSWFSPVMRHGFFKIMTHMTDDRYLLELCIRTRPPARAPARGSFNFFYLSSVICVMILVSGGSS